MKEFVSVKDMFVKEITSLPDLSVICKQLIGTSMKLPIPS